MTGERPIDFADVKVGMTVRQTWPDGTTLQGRVTATAQGDPDLISIGSQTLFDGDCMNLTLIADSTSPPIDEPQELGTHVLCDDGEWGAMQNPRPVADDRVSLADVLAVVDSAYEAEQWINRVALLNALRARFAPDGAE